MRLSQRTNDVLCFCDRSMPHRCVVSNNFSQNHPILKSTNCFSFAMNTQISGSTSEYRRGGGGDGGGGGNGRSGNRFHPYGKFFSVCCSVPQKHLQPQGTGRILEDRRSATLTLSKRRLATRWSSIAIGASSSMCTSLPRVHVPRTRTSSTRVSGPPSLACPRMFTGRLRVRSTRITSPFWTCAVLSCVVPSIR